MQEFLLRAKKFFIAVIQWVVSGISALQKSLTDENIKVAQHIVDTSLMVLSRQFWKFG